MCFEIYLQRSYLPQVHWHGHVQFVSSSGKSSYGRESTFGFLHIPLRQVNSGSAKALAHVFEEATTERFRRSCPRQQPGALRTHDAQGLQRPS